MEPCGHRFTVLLTITVVKRQNKCPIAFVMHNNTIDYDPKGARVPFDCVRAQSRSACCVFDDRSQLERRSSTTKMLDVAPDAVQKTYRPRAVLITLFGVMAHANWMDNMGNIYFDRNFVDYFKANKNNPAFLSRLEDLRTRSYMEQHLQVSS